MCNPKNSRETNATFLDYCSGSDDAYRITGIGPCQCLGELWADEGGKSVLHGGSPLGARPRLWQLGGMTTARWRRASGGEPHDPSYTLTKPWDAPTYCSNPH